MNETPTLFDVLAAIEARDEAINKAENNANPHWKQAAEMAIRSIAVDRNEFTSDDVWLWLHDMAIEMPHEPRALGAMMVRASRQGLIKTTDRVRQSERPECHARPIRIWRSLIVQAG